MLLMKFFEKSTISQMSSPAKIKNHFLLALTAILGGAFAIYHLLLDQYYCLSADDFSGINYASQGIPGFTYAWHFYWNWEGPFLSHLIVGFLMWTVSVGLPPVVVLFTVKLAMVFSNAVMLKATSSRFQLKWSTTFVLLASIVFVTVLYLISPNSTEIWHWLIGMVYLIPIIFLQLGAAALIANRFYLAIIPLAVVMQSRATYAVLIFGFIVLLSIINWSVKSENRKRWVLVSLLSGLFLTIYLIAPGNYVRLTEHGNSTAFLISQFKVGLHNLFLSFNLAKMDRVLLGLLAVLPFLPLTNMTFPKPGRVWQWGVPLFLYVSFAVAHETLFVYITGYREWTRVLSLHSFLFLIICSVYGFWIYGSFPFLQNRKFAAIAIIGVGGLLFQLFQGIESEMEQGKLLTERNTIRMEQIMNRQETGDTLYIAPMNYNGILYFEDFSEDPDNWINGDFRKTYDLDFKIAVKSEE